MSNSSCRFSLKSTRAGGWGSAAEHHTLRYLWLIISLYLALTANVKLAAEQPLFDFFALHQKVKFVPNNAHFIENFFTYIFKPGVALPLGLQFYWAPAKILGCSALIDSNAFRRTSWIIFEIVKLIYPCPAYCTQFLKDKVSFGRHP